MFWVVSKIRKGPYDANFVLSTTDTVCCPRYIYTTTVTILQRHNWQEIMTGSVARHYPALPREINNQWKSLLHGRMTLLSNQLACSSNTSSSGSAKNPKQWRKWSYLYLAWSELSKNKSKLHFCVITCDTDNWHLLTSCRLTMGANNSTRRVSFESDENDNVTVVKGIRVSDMMDLSWTGVTWLP